MNDADFLRAFEAAAIPLDRWAHRDHIRMAFLYLRDRPFDQALGAIRAGILALNSQNQVPDTATSGYHETVTVAWARLIVSTVAHHGPSDSFEALADANPHLLAKTLLRLFYIRGRILTPQAKAGFVTPDLAPLPGLPGER